MAEVGRSRLGTRAGAVGRARPLGARPRSRPTGRGARPAADAAARRRPDPARRGRLDAGRRLGVELVPHAAEMLALGVPDHRPSRLPALVADLLADDDARLTSAIVWWPTSGSTRSTAHVSPTVASPRRSATSCTTRTCSCRGTGTGSSTGRRVGLTPLRPPAGDLADGGAGTRPGERPSGPAAAAGLLSRCVARPRDTAAAARAVRPHAARRALQRALTMRRILRGVHADERAHWADAAPGWMAQHLEPGPLTPAARRG
jgi:hypothetical protein